MNKIICLKGDGIGPEIMDSSIKVLRSISKDFNFEYELLFEDFGGVSIDKHGEPFTNDLKEKLNNADAVLLACIGSSKYDSAPVRPEQGLLELRKYLNLYANIRPLKVSDSLLSLSPLKPEIVKGSDLVIVRELSSGIYFGEPRFYSDEEAYDTMRYNKKEITRIVDYAFKIASKRNKKVTSVDKANVLASSKLFRKISIDVSKNYPDVTLEHRYVDAMAMELITKPSSFDVIVTSNLFGDILSDEASVLGGSLGLLASSSFSETGISLYEPAHGSAPDIAGLNIANPIAMISSMSMMLRYSFDQDNLSNLIDDCIDRVLNEGYYTKDLDNENYLSTTDWTNKLIEKIQEVKHEYII
ncbi:MAG: 3-isopropylmalate dehydrogenase [Erysipelotrichaceae bacterium]|nr:3-isopropylmalate dehydrogenase [Erysipelotrichaceae bacterium]